MSKAIEDLASRLQSDLKALSAQTEKVSPEPDPNAPPPKPVPTDEEKEGYKKLLDSVKGSCDAMKEAVEAEEKKIDPEAAKTKETKAAHTAGASSSSSTHKT